MITLVFICIPKKPKKKIENEKNKEEEINKIWNDKYLFEACATGCYPLGMFYSLLSFEAILLLRKLAFYVNKSIMKFVSVKWD